MTRSLRPFKNEPKRLALSSVIPSASALESLSAPASVMAWPAGSASPLVLASVSRVAVRGPDQLLRDRRSLPYRHKHISQLLRISFA